MIARLFCFLGWHRYAWTPVTPELKTLNCVYCGKGKSIEYLIRVSDPALRKALAENLKKMGVKQAGLSVHHRSEEDLYK